MKRSSAEINRVEASFSFNPGDFNAVAPAMNFGIESLSRQGAKRATLNFFVDGTNHLK
jgi:hypothetical protein